MIDWHTTTTSDLSLFQGVLSVVFGGVWDVPIADTSKDYWLLVAFRRFALEFYIKESIGHSHLVAMNWLRLDLLARMVECGHDVRSLSSEVDLAQQYGTQEEQKVINTNWYDAGGGQY